jgi:hypothetical protein
MFALSHARNAERATTQRLARAPPRVRSFTSEPRVCGKAPAGAVVATVRLEANATYDNRDGRSAFGLTLAVYTK